MSSAERLLRKKYKPPLMFSGTNSSFSAARMKFNSDCEINTQLDSLTDSILDREILENYTSELATTNLSSYIKKKRNFDSKLEQYNTKDRNSAKGLQKTSDYELFLSAMNRVNVLLKDVAKKNEDLYVANRTISQLKQDLNILKLSEPNNILENESFKELQRKSNSTQKQIKEMEEFLADYGLVWVGSNDSEFTRSQWSTCRGIPNISSGSTAIEICGNSLSLRTFDRLLEAINLLNDNTSSEETAVVLPVENGREPRIARLSRVSSVPLILYADGILMFQGPFRAFSQTSTLQFLQDILDGFFPTELQSRYPNGVSLDVIDKREEHYRYSQVPLRGTENDPFPIYIHKLDSAFDGVGRRLGGDDRVSRLFKSKQTTLDQSDQQKNELHEDKTIEKPKLTPEDIFSVLSSPSFLHSNRGGEIDSVINASELETNLKMISCTIGEMGSGLPKEGEIDLRVRSPSGDHIFNFKASYSDSMASLRKSIEQFCPITKADSYRLVQISSAGGLGRTVLDADAQTLVEAGIQKSAVLFMESKNHSPIQDNCGLFSRGTSP